MNSRKLGKIVIIAEDSAWKEKLPQLDGDGPAIHLFNASEREGALRELGDADALCAANIDDELVRAGTKLQWIQLIRGGVNKRLPEDLIKRDIVVTCLKDLFAAPGAEFALMAILMIQRRMTWAVGKDSLSQGMPSMEKELNPEDVEGLTVGILGLGKIGVRTAELCKAFGLRLLGTARRNPPSVPGVDKVYATAETKEMMALCDFVILATPLTDETAGMFDDEMFQAMKSGSWFIDVSARPKLINYPAMVRAVESGHLGGVFLQPGGPTFNELPDDSPFWKHANVVVSPCRCVSRQQKENAVEIFLENLALFEAGTSLRGLVDKQAGY